MLWRLLVAVIALAFSGFDICAQVELKSRMKPALPSAQLYPEPKPLNEFSLLGGDGKPFGRDRWLDGWMAETWCFSVTPIVLMSAPT